MEGYEGYFTWWIWCSILRFFQFLMNLRFGGTNVVIFNGNLRLEKLGGNRCTDVRTDRRTYGNSPLCSMWHQPFGDAAQKIDKKQPLRYYFVWGGGRAEECGWGWTRNLFNLPMDFISFSNSKEPKICDQSNQNDKKLTFFTCFSSFPLIFEALPNLYALTYWHADCTIG